MDKKDIIITMIIISMIILAIYGAYLIQRNIICPNLGEALNLETKYKIFAGGCFVKTQEGQWVQSKNYYNSIPK